MGRGLICVCVGVALCILPGEGATVPPLPYVFAPLWLGKEGYEGNRDTSPPLPFCLSLPFCLFGPLEKCQNT